VVGVTGFFNPDGSLKSVGIQSALCHSTVDNSLAQGIGHRLDGWANRDLNVGDIVSLAPNLQPFADLLGVDQATVRKVLHSWGAGHFDAELALDGLVSPGLIQNVPAPLGPVSVLMLHGDQDQTVLYCGQANVASQEESFNYWSTADHCSTLDTSAALCDTQRNITGVSEKHASGWSAGTEVQFYELEGGTHQWYLTPMNISGQSPFNPAFNSTTGVTPMTSFGTSSLLTPSREPLDRLRADYPDSNRVSRSG
jgi:hypothetical protein